MDDVIPAGADPVWQPPFWILAQNDEERSYAEVATYLSWKKYFEDRMDVELPAMFRDAFFNGHGVLLVPSEIPLLDAKKWH